MLWQIKALLMRRPSDPETPREASAFPVMIPDEMTLDELAKQAPVSGQQDEAGIATQGQSTSSAPADVVQLMQLCKNLH